MTSSWQVLLATRQEAKVGYMDGEEAGLIALEDYSLLEITGAEAESFLQGQFCNDLSEVSKQRAQLSGYCTPKGRLLALFTLLATDNGFLMIVGTPLRDSLVKRLQMFIMRADVSIVAREELLCSGVISANGAGSELGIPSLAVMEVTQSADGIWVRVGASQYYYIADEKRQQSLWSSDTPNLALDAWRLRNIQSGFPTLQPATVEQFVPQMVNLQQAGGLSFKKGCYPGQEIVARMQYLGKLKRQMLRFSFESDAEGANEVKAGDKVVAGDDSEAGVIVDAVQHGSQVELLAVMKLAVLDSPLSVSGHELSRQPLPYSLE